ncbi:hypothetical protein QVD17_37595 [Tagetes erecta]|uniref:Uncharacterized protein n=1 Tax=Tagetes erecta TaxID=13708 RepID=A0AAD8JWZ8_TARER|nr:hypothetical protein QVD17_37595 [Tagetes erecta]
MKKKFSQHLFSSFIVCSNAFTCLSISLYAAGLLSLFVTYMLVRRICLDECRASCLSATCCKVAQYALYH